jgi:hypothetical protein
MNRFALLATAAVALAVSTGCPGSPCNSSGNGHNEFPCSGSISGADSTGNAIKGSFSCCVITPLLQGTGSTGNTLYDFGVTSSPSLSQPTGATKISFNISGTQPTLMGTFGSMQASGCMTSELIYVQSSTTELFSGEGEVQGPDCDAKNAEGSVTVAVTSNQLVQPPPAPANYWPHGTATGTLFNGSCTPDGGTMPCQGGNGQMTFTLTF